MTRSVVSQTYTKQISVLFLRSVIICHYNLFGVHHENNDDLDVRNDPNNDM